MAERMGASIQEILALEARLIHRIAKLRAAVETVHDAMAHLNALRSFCEDVLAADDETRCAVAPGAVRKKPEQYSVKSRRLLPMLALMLTDAPPDWSRAFDDPIPLPDGRVLRTLHDAGNYATALPKAV